jgi:hypothetical protein
VVGRADVEQVFHDEQYFEDCCSGRGDSFEEGKAVVVLGWDEELLG